MNNLSNLDFGAIIAVLTFALGFIINGYMNKRHKRRELNLYKNLIISWTESHKKAIDNFTNSLQKFGSEVKNNIYMNIPQYDNYLMSLERLNSIPIEKIADVFMINIKIKDEEDSTEIAAKHMHRYIASIEYLSAVSIKVMKYRDDYEIEAKNIMNEWNTNFLNLKYSLISRTTHVKWNETSPEEQCLYKKIEDMFLMMQLLPKNEDCEAGMPIWDEKFIHPAMTYIEQSIGNNPQLLSSEIFITISTYIAGLQFLFMKWQANKGFGCVFLDTHKHVVSCCKDIYEAIEYFKNHRLRHSLYIK
ncbi:MAG: hypothetical protein LBV47_07460 [Bacteroidales bacterium]|jgi:hypothetical protein|nr:hypothetical protein [Bacteroidales bacterium]